MKNVNNYYCSSDLKRDDFLNKLFHDSIISGNFELNNMFINPIDDRTFWENIPENVKKRYVKLGEEFLNYKWQSLSVMEYVDFFNSKEDCNRPACELICREKVTAVVHMMIAECIENKGRFLRNIIDGIFSICEQSTWAVSAHFNSCGDNPKINFDGVNKIPDYEVEIVDLYCAKVASAIALVSVTLKTKFDLISPMIYKRARYEVEKRFINPYLLRDEFWWLTINTDLDVWPVNNWNPHMNSSLIYCALAMCEDKDKIKKLLIKAISSLDAYINLCSDDGACDEGSGYWSAAFSKLSDAVAMLETITGIKGFFEIEKIKKMAEYVLNVRICGNTYYCYSDANKSNDSLSFAVNVFFLGKYLNDYRFLNEGSYLYKICGDLIGEKYDALMDVFCEYKKMIISNDIGEYTNMPSHNKAVWYNDTQILISREQCNDENGIFVAAKAGHNNENHNHNDVGSYCIYIDQKACIVDLGVCTYTRELFGEERYNIFSVRSKNHNVPMISCLEQAAGKKYASKNVKCILSDSEDMLIADISQCYPEKLGIKSLERSICHCKKQKIIRITDTFDFEKEEVYENVFMIPQKILVDDNIVVGENFVLECETENVLFENEEIVLNDNVLIKQWGNIITRVVAKHKGKNSKICFTVRKK